MKVTLTVKQAKFVESLRVQDESDHAIYNAFVEKFGLDSSIIIMKALSNGYDVEECTHVDLETVRIWKSDYKRKGDQQTVERYNVRIKELDITLSVTKERNRKTYEVLDAAVKKGRG
jgi:hypothetical protein